MIRKLLAVLLASLALSTMGATCLGYELKRESEAALPGDVRSLAVPLARNRTIEAGLEDVFTNELVERLSADGRVLIVSPGEAEADLNCTLTELKIQPRAYNRAGMVSVERAQLTIECVLNAPQTESVIWKSGSLAQSEEYPLGNDYLANEDQKALALREVCRDLSESIRTLLLDSF